MHLEHLVKFFSEGEKRNKRPTYVEYQMASLNLFSAFRYIENRDTKLTTKDPLLRLHVTSFSRFVSLSVSLFRQIERVFLHPLFQIQSHIH